MAAGFEQLIKDNAGRIRAIARRYADEGGEEDLLQEILEQLWRSYGSFRGESRPETWIYRVGFNTAMTHLRSLAREREGKKKLLGLRQAGRSGGERCEADILRDFLASLSDIDASVLMMYLDGLSAREMAQVLGTRPNTLEVRISRLKKAFRSRYLEEQP